MRSPTISPCLSRGDSSATRLAISSPVTACLNVAQIFPLGVLHDRDRADLSVEIGDALIRKLAVFLRLDRDERFHLGLRLLLLLLLLAALAFRFLPKLSERLTMPTGFSRSMRRPAALCVELVACGHAEPVGELEDDVVLVAGLRTVVGVQQHVRWGSEMMADVINSTKGLLSALHASMHARGMHAELF